MNKADNIVKIYACKAATNNSNTEMNNVIGIDKPDQAIFPLIKMIPTNEITTMCPAVIFANKRIANAKGFTNKLIISIIVINGTTPTGTPGIANTCRQ